MVELSEAKGSSSNNIKLQLEVTAAAEFERPVARIVVSFLEKRVVLLRSPTDHEDLGGASHLH